MQTPSFRDDASKISDASFSTAYDQTEIPPRQLRRRSTVTTLKRWASKRVSRASLNDTQGNELSEKNLSSLEHETRYPGGNNKDFNLKEVAEGKELAKRNGSIQEAAETLPDHDMQEDRDPYILQDENITTPNNYFDVPREVVNKLRKLGHYWKRGRFHNTLDLPTPTPLPCYDSACLYGDAARHSRAKTIPAKKPLATTQVAIFKRVAT
ncbi:unnamed protein product [Penicillium pancosmium]